jgi:hypothetical protein
MKIFIHVIVGLALIWTMPTVVLAQSEENENPVDDQAKRIDELEEKIQKIDKKFQQEVDELKEKNDQLEEDIMMQDAGDTTNDMMKISGFFDLTFIKMFVPDDLLMKNVLPDTSSFIMQSLNLYFNSQISDTLEAMVELRLSFLPLGERLTDNSSGTVSYQDTTVHDPLTNAEFQLGGLAIERVHLTWQPVDFFGIVAGRFLTPYGIWNVDHGSPVLIPVRVPYIQVQNLVPLKQTGLQIFGRFFPARRLYFDYAFTVSNGRGPVESLLDLDENKGLGLRLKLSYEGEKFEAALGGYGYWGEYTAAISNLESVDPVSFGKTITENYTEYVGALDLRFQFFGVLLQGEYVRTLTKYSERPLKNLWSGGQGYQADFVNNTSYVLLAYKLPLDRWLGTMSISPYLMWESMDTDDSEDNPPIQMFNGGINFKPSQAVVLKVEGAYMYADEVYGDGTTGFGIISAQMAVSF